jgi:hypothetical protein
MKLIRLEPSLSHQANIAYTHVCLAPSTQPAR